MWHLPYGQFMECADLARRVIIPSNLSNRFDMVIEYSTDVVSYNMYCVISDYYTHNFIKL